MDAKFICLEEPAFYELVDQVYQRLKDKHTVKEDQWITADEAMRLLRITSKTTLQKYRDEGQILYTQVNQRVILYDRTSIMEFLKINSRETF
ncbi:helix-turn-helix domain-containing protein [Mucilaginibacter sp. cycad4]|uniref:helix-turn-helix domain-containing protein n=1 Tax=Mucilaginibacter sp. cycad4 TaxID=3342096 RepID=UPI002AAADB10|nr:helix-turn-helix domain-containing protein [Mucilaginibacter gossypii]WPU98603.1 helix-turn-helix domain-containing protein [Mucilaginibacter gossypii]